MRGTLSMREACIELEDMQATVEHIIEHMNQNESNRGGFEQRMYDLRHQVADAKDLLLARIQGQLRPMEEMPEYDKPLHRC